VSPEEGNGNGFMDGLAEHLERTGSLTGSIGDINNSPATGSNKRHQPGVKRACNDCRQQKVSSTWYMPLDHSCAPISLPHAITCSPRVSNESLT
jgi:hypothetical protein